MPLPPKITNVQLYSWLIYLLREILKSPMKRESIVKKKMVISTGNKYLNKFLHRNKNVIILLTDKYMPSNFIFTTGTRIYTSKHIVVRNTEIKEKNVTILNDPCILYSCKYFSL